MRALLLAFALLVMPLVAEARTATWTDNSAGTASTEIERAVGACAVPALSFATIVTVPPGVGYNPIDHSEEYVDNEPLTPGQAYCYRARAVNAAGASAYSNLADWVEPVAPAPAPTDLKVTMITWKVCALEDAACAFTGTHAVRYGDGTAWITKTVTDGTLCSNAVFGGDPLPGVKKHCEIAP